MKKTYGVLVILLSAAIFPTPSRAQLLKTFLANAKKTIAGNTSGNSTSGKKDSSSQASTFDSAAIMQKLARMKSSGASASTSPSVSTADSAAAIQHFKIATGGSGQYYRYLNTYTLPTKKGKDSVFADTMAIALSDAHFVRTSFSTRGAETVILARPSTPLYVVMLHSDSRTYALHVVDTAAIRRGDGWTYRVTKIGSDRVGQYDCTHARITMSKPGTKEPISEDVWTSTKVPGYAILQQLGSMRNLTPAAMRSLEQAGCEGFIIKMTMHGAAYSMEILLTEAGRKDFSAADFEIPQDYSQERQANSYGRLFQQ